MPARRPAGGGDASVEYLVLPDGMDIEKEHAAYREWYRTYVAGQPHHQYKSLIQWLLERGARTPSDDELEVFCED